VGVVLGLCIAAGFGSGDFLGGRSSRAASTIAVVAIVQCVAFAGAVVAAIVVAGHADSGDLALGAAAGAANVIGVALLYRGLASGRMAVVAPVTAVMGAVVPVAWGLVRGESPTGVTMAGVALAVAGGGLLAAAGDDDETERRAALTPVLCALGAGAVLGASFVCYAATNAHSGMQPILAARVVSLGLALAVVAATRTRRPVWPHGVARWQAGGAGLCDMGASVVLVVAVRRALTVVVAPVAALAPAFTVLWARVLLRERFGRLQLAGICTGLAGLVLIAAG